VRINPTTRHSETKYGFVILTGDMIFKHFFVGVKLLLRHEHLSIAAANSHQNQLTCHASKTKLRLTCSPFDRRRLSPSPRPLLSIPQKVLTGNVVMDTNLRAAHTREKLLCPIGASVVHQMGFFVEVGELAETEGHHPDISFGWGYATVSLNTKKIKGLHENDFIMASKIDRLLDRPDGSLDHKQ
jgi:hypothetical protein